MKKIMIITTVLIAAVSLVSAPASAGSRHHDVAQGILMGAGAVILGSAIAHGFNDHSYDRGPRFGHRPRFGHGYYEGYGHPGFRNHRHNKRCGYRQVWVPPIHRQEWVRGHYNRYGRWMPGRYVQVVERPGYWEKGRVCRR